jgi:hypothetical protein
MAAPWEDPELEHRLAQWPDKSQGK